MRAAPPPRVRLPVLAIAIAVAISVAPGSVAATPAASSPATTDAVASPSSTAPDTATTPPAAPDDLRPGDFTWLPEAAPSGPLLLVVSLRQQRAYLYRNGVRIAVSTVSTGKAGFETLPGIYTVLEKDEEHYSNLYDNAPMPFMQRLTWSGFALHAGRLPGYPASHGCVRLPEGFARRLFEVTPVGMTVLVGDDPALSTQWSSPGWLAPALPAPKAATDAASPPAAEPALPAATVAAAPAATVGTDVAAVLWAPERAPVGPVTIVASTAERSLRVLRAGVLIGSAPLEVEGDLPAGTHVLQLQPGSVEDASAYVPGRPRLNWVMVAMPAKNGDAPPRVALDAVYGRMRVPAELARAIYDVLRPGDTVVVTDGGFGLPSGDWAPLEAAPAPSR